MKKRFFLFPLLIILAVALIMPFRAAAAEPFIDNPRWHETTAASIDSRYQADESFIVVFYRQTCFNSNIRKILLDEWMNTYKIDLYAVDFDVAGMPEWVWDSIGYNGITLPVITIVDCGTVTVFDASSSMRVINQAVLEYMGVYDGQDIDFYTANKAVYQKYAVDRYTAEKLYLKSSSSISSEIVSQAKSVTSGLSTDRAKVKAIYDWIAENIYYDYGMLEGYIPYYVSAEDTYCRGMSVCAGYANLTVDMCNAVGIPCRFVTGFATGIGSDDLTGTVWNLYKQYRTDGNLTSLRNGIAPYENHAWNEAYVNGEWLILDATWGSNNDAYWDNTNGSYGLIAAPHTDEYFDPDLAFFSESHLFLTDYSVVYPKITLQPASVTSVSNENAIFKVTATGTGLKYQWQYSKDSGQTWFDSSQSGCKTATLTVAATVARNGYYYRCIVSNDAGALTSSSAKLTVKENPVITTQPVSVTSAAGKTVTFRVVATGTSLTYQWQYSMDNGGKWYNSTMTGYNTTSMQVPVTSARNGYLYHCIVKSSTGSTTSSSAKLTVSGVVPAIRVQPTSVSSLADKTVTFKIVAAGTGLSYQWQYSMDNGGKWYSSTMTGYNTSSMQVPVVSGRNGYLYRCIVTNSSGSTTSSSAMLTVITKPSVTTQPTSSTVAENASARFTIKASGASLSYQWQYSSDNGKTWADSSQTGSKTASLTVTATSARNGMLYRCRVTNSAGTVTSSAAKLTVSGVKPVIRTQPASVTSAVDKTAAFSVAAAGSGLSYQWQYSSDNGKTWADSSQTGSKTSVLKVAATAARSGMLYRCQVKNTAGTVTSSIAKLTVSGVKPVIRTQPSSVTSATDETVTFKISAAGTGLSYQWQYSKDNGKTWTDSAQTGNKTASLSVKATAARNGMLYRCRVTNSCGTVTSSSAKLTVK